MRKTEFGVFANGAVTAALAYAVAAGARSAVAPREPNSGDEPLLDLSERKRLAAIEVEKAFESGALDSSRKFSSSDVAAKSALAVLDPISRSYSIELGAFIFGPEGGRSYGQILYGTEGSSPQEIGDVPRLNLVCSQCFKIK